MRQESLTIGRMLSRQLKSVEWNERSIQELASHIVRKSRQYEVSPYLVLSLIHVESSFRPTAISGKGAVGMMQLMPETAAELAANGGLAYHGPGALHDPKLNIELGIRYIVWLQKKFPTYRHILTAYNIGPAALYKKLKSGEELNLGFYRKVMGAKRFYEREAKAGDRQWL